METNLPAAGRVGVEIQAPERLPGLHSVRSRSRRQLQHAARSISEGGGARRHAAVRQRGGGGAGAAVGARGGARGSLAIATMSLKSGRRTLTRPPLWYAAAVNGEVD